MQVVNIENVKVSGLKVRTNNNAEMSADTAKIGKLWEDVSDKCFPHMLVGGSVYGIYHNYESDVTGEYDLLVGSDKFSPALENLESVEIIEGKYLKFEATGEMPDVCINLWQQVWEFFSAESCEYDRAYTTDFEKYTQNGVEIYIAIK